MSFFTSKLFTSPEKSVIGVDIGASSLKIVQIRQKKGRAVLETYGQIGLGPYNKLAVGQVVNLSPGEITNVIKDLIKGAEISSMKGGMSIPLKLSLITLLDIPKVEGQDLNTIIPIEARKYIPIPINEVTMDWFVIPEIEDSSVEYMNDAVNNSSQRIKVLLVAMHNQVLNNYTTIVKDSGLETEFFEVESFATARGSLIGETDPVMIIDFGATGVKTYMIDGGLLVSSHIINRGGQDITFSISKGLNTTFDQAEHLKRNLGNGNVADEAKILDLISIHTEYIFSEIQLTLSAFQKKNNKTISKIILTGGGSSLKSFKPDLEKKMTCKVEFADPFSKLETPAFLAESLKTTGLSFTTAIGLALRALQD